MANPNIETPPLLISYPVLFDPKPKKDAKPGDKYRYSCELYVPAAADITALQQAAYAALKDKFGDKTDGMLKNNLLNWPFRKDFQKAQSGEDRIAEPGRFKCWIRTWSVNKPAVVERYDFNGDGKPDPITDPQKIYSGCFVKAVLQPFAYPAGAGKAGVLLALQAIQFWEDGERLGGGFDPTGGFTAESAPAADVASALPVDAVPTASTSKASGLADLFT